MCTNCLATPDYVRNFRELRQTEFSRRNTVKNNDFFMLRYIGSFSQFSENFKIEPFNDKNLMISIAENNY